MLRSARSHALRVLVAAATTLSPLAQAKAETSATDHLTPQSVAAATIRLADLAAAPAMQQLPVEVLAAATEDFLGLPLESIERITLVVDPPVGATPQYAVFVDTTATIDFGKFRGEILEKFAPSTLLDRPALAPSDAPPLAPWACLIDDNTLAIGPKLFLKRFIRGVDGSASELAAAMRSGDGEANHFHAAVTLQPLRPFIEIGLMAAKNNPEVPPETHKFFDAALLLDRVIVAGDFSGQRSSYLHVHATDKAAADRLQTLMPEWVTFWRQRMENDEEFNKLRNHEEAVVRAWVTYLNRYWDKQTEELPELRKGDDLFELGRFDAGDSTTPVVMIAVVGVLISLLLPAVQAAREAARRNTSLNNIKQLMLSWHNHHDVYRNFPAQAICAADGTPLLSWRVAILPFLEENELYEKFHLDEPWDSPHNLALLPEMPLAYLDPSSGLGETAGKAHYLSVVGPDAGQDGGPRGRSFRHFSDGTSRSLVMVQVDDAHAVPWTKPTDFSTAAHGANPIGGIGTLHPGGFLAGFADGHTRFIQESTEPELLRAIMTINGGEMVELP